MDGVWAPLSSVTPGCAFHLPRRNSPARGVAAPEKGRLPLINVFQKLQPRRYGAEMAPFISPPSARARGAGKQQPAPGKPQRSCAFGGRGGSSAAPNSDSAPPDPTSSRSLRASLDRGLHESAPPTLGKPRALSTVMRSDRPGLGCAAGISLRSECFLEAEPERAQRSLPPAGHQFQVCSSQLAIPYRSKRLRSLIFPMAGCSWK